MAELRAMSSTEQEATREAARTLRRGRGRTDDALSASVDVFGIV